ncbi:hypothetical protein GCM10027073_68440 [Streptomyces chlorus]
MPQDRERSFFDSSGWWVFWLVVCAWNAAGSSSPWWSRLGSLVLCGALSALLLRRLIGQRRSRKPAPPGMRD